jgi:hypothetical protein
MTISMIATLEIALWFYLCIPRSKNHLHGKLDLPRRSVRRECGDLAGRRAEDGIPRRLLRSDSRFLAARLNNLAVEQVDRAVGELGITRIVGHHADRRARFV